MTATGFTMQKNPRWAILVAQKQGDVKPAAKALAKHSGNGLYALQPGSSHHSFVLPLNVLMYY